MSNFQAATDFLRNLDADWSEHIEVIGPCKHASKPAREPYEALIRAIAYQQLHAKAGDAILERFFQLYPDQLFPDPDQIIKTPIVTLQKCGFSASKIATINAIAKSYMDGVVPSRESALNMADEELIKTLTTIRGIGRWTVEMLLIYTLERPDILPIDDYGVREGYRRLKRMTETPTPQQMRNISALWSPHRTVASWYLWRSIRERPPL